MDEAITAALGQLRELHERDLGWEAHPKADAILLAFIRAIGAPQVADAYVELQHDSGGWFYS